jgi:hypothetical protein
VRKQDGRRRRVRDRIEHGADGARGVHDQGGALEAVGAGGAERGQAQGGGEGERLVGEQGEREVLELGEPGELLGALRADADHSGVGGCELGQAVAEGAGFERAAGAAGDVRPAGGQAGVDGR